MPRNKATERLAQPNGAARGTSATAKPKARKKQPVANPICKPLDDEVWRRVKNAAAVIPAPGPVLPSEWQWLQDQCRAVAALSFTAANVETMREALPRLRHVVARAYWQNVAAGKALCGTDPSPCANDRMMYAMLSAYDTERGARVQRTIRFEPVNDDRAALRLPPAGLGEGDFDGCSLTVGAELTCWTEIASWLSDSDRLNRITLPDTMPDRHGGDPEASTAGGPLEWVQRRQWAKYMADVCARLADADAWDSEQNETPIGPTEEPLKTLFGVITTAQSSLHQAAILRRMDEVDDDGSLGWPKQAQAQRELLKKLVDQGFVTARPSEAYRNRLIYRANDKTNG